MSLRAFDATMEARFAFVSDYYLHLGWFAYNAELWFNFHIIYSSD